MTRNSFFHLIPVNHFLSSSSARVIVSRSFTAECLTRIKFYELDDALESSAGGKDVLSF